MTDFVLSELLANYVEDHGFTGSSMHKAIDAAYDLETKAARRRGADHPRYLDRLSGLLIYMRLEAYTSEDMLTAVRWAKSLEQEVAK